MSSTFGHSPLEQTPSSARAAETIEPGAFPRRGLLTGAVAGVAAVAAGGALGYKFRSAIDSLRATLSGRATAAVPEPDFKELAERAFHDQARQIHERHRLQTVEAAAALRRKYEKPVFGRVHVWDLIEKLGQCVDVTDHTLCGASQLLHVQQTLAAMEQHGIEDPDLFLIALIHDLGKVLLLTGEISENVCCPARRIGEFAPGIGLDQVAYQFGHAELIYSRVKDLVPAHIAWTVRYHNVDLLDAAEFMDDRDRAFAEEYLTEFRTFDKNYKSLHWVPNFNAAKYRELVQRYFPEPILF
jgi:hypothetical protein